MFAKKQDDGFIYVKDIVSEHIVCTKHVNYIEKCGLELHTPYMVKVAFYTNAKGYREADFCEIYSYVPKSSATNKSKPEKPTAQAKASSQTKPSWLR